MRHPLVARALQDLGNHREHLTVADPTRHRGHHPIVPDGVELASARDVDHAAPAAAQSHPHLLDRLMRRPSRPPSEGAVREIGFEDPFQNLPQRALYHAVWDRRDRDHADFATLLGNLSSTKRSEAIRAGAQVREEVPEEGSAAARPNPPKRLAVESMGAVVALCLQIGRFERADLDDIDL